ncbi:MAG: hypothetical protein Tsb0020_11660 [Haliangiales bacterium]
MLWGVYLFLPVILGLFFTPLDELTSIDQLLFNITCNGIGTLCIMGTGHLLMLVTGRLFPGRYGRLQRALILASVVLIAVLVGTELSILLERSRHPGTSDMTLRLLAYRNGLPLAIVVILALQAVDRLTFRIHRSEERELAVQRLALQAQARALQARTHPHFFFNALNALTELVHQSPERAEEALLQLAELYRYTLDAALTPRTALRNELAALDDYLALERLRFDDRLQVTVDVAPEVLNAQIPPLSIQPLVENAIRHGLGSGGTRVDVQVTCDDGALQVRVINDGSGQSGHSRGTGTSVADLQQRLALLHGDEAWLEHGPRGPGEGGGYQVIMRLPITTGATLEESERDHACADRR